MTEYNTDERKALLDLAKQSISFGLEHNKCMEPDLTKYPVHLCEDRACFVTLHLKGELRGCIGSLIAHNPLITDVVQNAYAAAFQDPRFFPLTRNEFKLINLEISILSKPKKMSFSSEKNLLSKIRPKVDGLILTSGIHKGIFLPTVWEELKTPELFLKHLKNKAGLDFNYWSDDIEIERYTTELIK